MKALSDLAKDALELSSRQRIALARILLDLSELDAPYAMEAEKEWDDEIYRRMKAVEAGTAQSRGSRGSVC